MAGYAESIRNSYIAGFYGGASAFAEEEESALRNVCPRPHRPVHNRASLQLGLPYVDRAIQPPIAAMVVWHPSSRDQVAEFFRQVRALWIDLKLGAVRFKAFLDNVSRAMNRWMG